MALQCESSGGKKAANQEEEGFMQNGAW